MNTQRRLGSWRIRAESRRLRDDAVQMRKRLRATRERCQSVISESRILLADPPCSLHPPQSTPDHTPQVRALLRLLHDDRK